MKFAGSESILNLIGRQILNDEDPETVLDNAINYAEKQYQQEIDEFEAATGGSPFELT